MLLRFALVAALSLISTLAIADKPLKVVYFNNYAPFSWEENGEMRGIFIDVLNQAISEQLDIPIIHQGFPWKRAQKMVASGEADAFVTVPTRARRAYTQVSSQPIIPARVTLFVKARNPNLSHYQTITKISDLKCIRLGNYLGNGWAKENLHGLEVDWSPSLDTTIRNLFHSRYELLVGNSQSIRYNIKRLGYESKIMEINNSLATATFNLCIGNHSLYRSIIGEFDKVLRQLRESGALNEIYRHYQ